MVGGVDCAAQADAKARSSMARVGLYRLLGPREPRKPNGIVCQGYFWYKSNAEKRAGDL